MQRYFHFLGFLLPSYGGCSLDRNMWLCGPEVLCGSKSPALSIEWLVGLAVGRRWSYLGQTVLSALSEWTLQHTILNPKSKVDILLDWEVKGHPYST